MASRLCISVVICTRNRAPSLARALDSLTRCAPPQRSDWQLVVVDNGSSDETPRTLEAFAGRLPLRVVGERRPGLSHARNRGVSAADGNYLIWTDDDATVCPDWLRVYEAAFEAHPDAAFFAGPIRVRFEGTPPRWLEANLRLVCTAFAGLELPEQREPFDDRSRHLPFGANLALRAVEARAFPFDPALGRHPGRMFYGGEETDFLWRVTRAGAKGYWLPDAPVDHWIDPARQTSAYLRRYYVGVGYIGSPGDPRRVRRRLGGGLRMALRIARFEAIHLLGRLLGRDAMWMAALRDASLIRGRLLARLQLAARPAPSHSVEQGPA